MRLIKIICLSFGLSFVLVVGSGQEPGDDTTLESENAQREEIQRYFGYEDLLYRYVTLPYDVSANVNQQGKFVDIGFALFALLPLVFLYFIYERKKLFYGTILFFLLYLAVCFRFSLLFGDGNKPLYPAAADQSVQNEISGIDAFVLLPLYEASGFITYPVIEMLDGMTGDQDHITYPVLSVLFFCSLFMILRSRRLSEKIKLLSILIASFGFLWWLLSGGIIWYGFLLIPMGYFLIAYAIQHPGDPEIRAVRGFYSFTCMTVLVVWMLMAYIGRISNVSPFINQEHPDYGKQIVEPRLIPFTVGMIGERESLKLLSRNISVAIDRMNQDTSLILQFGSSLSFDIKSNDTRIFEDNNISYFYGLATNFRTKERIHERLKAYGFKYIILDLKLFTLDSTPERTLTEKFNLLLYGYIKDNDGIKLVATDQVVSINQTDGSKRQYMGVFGDEYPTLGSYAVFEIL